MLLEEGDGFFAGVGTLHDDFQNFLPEIAFAFHDCEEAVGIRSVFDGRFAVGGDLVGPEAIKDVH